MTIVILGGGNGTSFLAKVFPNAQYLINVFDSGGSTGKLRNGTPAVGDIRKVLSSLGSSLEYRPGTHPLGNLLLQSRLNKGENLLESINYVRKLYSVQTNVYPITNDDRHLIAHYRLTSLTGEHLIDTSDGEHGNPVSLTLNKPATLCVKPFATTLIIAPGDVWTSILPNFLVDGFKEWVSDKKIILCGNQKQKLGETKGWTTKDHIDVMEQYLGRKIDVYLTDSSYDFQVVHDSRIVVDMLTVNGVPCPHKYKEALCKHI